MARRRHTPEQVINKLREAEVATAEGSTVAEAPAPWFHKSLAQNMMPATVENDNLMIDKMPPATT